MYPRGRPHLVRSRALWNREEVRMVCFLPLRGLMYVSIYRLRKKLANLVCMVTDLQSYELADMHL